MIFVKFFRVLEFSRASACKLLKVLHKDDVSVFLSGFCEAKSVLVLLLRFKFSAKLQCRRCRFNLNLHLLVLVFFFLYHWRIDVVIVVYARLGVVAVAVLVACSFHAFSFLFLARLLHLIYDLIDIEVSTNYTSYLLIRLELIFRRLCGIGFVFILCVADILLEKLGVAWAGFGGQTLLRLQLNPGYNWIFIERLVINWSVKLERFHSMVDRVHIRDCVLWPLELVGIDPLNLLRFLACMRNQKLDFAVGRWSVSLGVSWSCI